MNASLKRQEFQFLIIAIASLILLFAFRYLLKDFQFQLMESHYLFLHTLLELFSIYVSLSIFVQAKITFSINRFYFFVGLVFLAVGVFDLMHTLYYKGMPFFSDQLSTARATWLWVIARLTESVGVALFITRPEIVQGKNKNFGILIALLIVSLVVCIVHFFPERLPRLIGESGGITPFKIGLEYLITTINLTTFIILLRRYRKSADIDSLNFLFGIFLIMVGEIFFTLYIHVYDLENLIGHFYKAYGYLLLYRSIFYPHYRYILTSKEMAERKQKEAESKLIEMEKSISQQIFEAHEEERKHVSRELHDGIGQSLYSILIMLNTAKKEKVLERKDEILNTVQTITETAMKEVREIAHSLRPSSLDDFGFVPALRSFLESYEQIHRIKTELNITGKVGRLKPEVETAMYRICQEALNNAAKYANPSTVLIEIEVFKNEIFLKIEDDGVGFSLEQYMGGSKRKGIGLFSIKERAEGIHGTATISSEINKGTTIIVKIPNNEEMLQAKE